MEEHVRNAVRHESIPAIEKSKLLKYLASNRKKIANSW